MTERPDPSAAPHPRLQTWIHALSILLGALVVLTIFFGSSVTSMNVGDSDPTWNPLLFLHWWRPAEGGLKVELDHRKFGTFVGIVAVLLFVLMLRGERRRSLRVAGLLALVAVCLQGLFGGLRVKAANDPEWSASLVRTFGSTDGVRIAFGMAHGFLAQIILAASLWIALMTGREWRGGRARAWAVTGSGPTRRWLWIVFGMLCVQLLLGTWLRHARFNTGHWVYTHLAWGLLTAGTLLFASARVKQRHPEADSLWRLSGLAGTLLILQVFLGFLAWVFVLDSQEARGFDLGLWIRAAHQLNGAAVLSLWLAACLRAPLVLKECPPQEAPAALRGREVVL